MTWLGGGDGTTFSGVSQVWLSLNVKILSYTLSNNVFVTLLSREKKQKINAFSKIVVTNALYFVFSTYPYSSSCQSRLRYRHVNHISRHKNLSNLISQQQILAIHGSRKTLYHPLTKELMKILVTQKKNPGACLG